MNFFRGKIRTYALDFFRMGVALISLIHILSLGNDYLVIYSRSGIIKPDIEKAIVNNLVPKKDIILQLASFFHTDEIQTLECIKYIYCFFIILLLIGVFTRVTAFFTWTLHITIVKSVFVFYYGIDYLTTTALLYCILMPVAGRLSLDYKLFKRNETIDYFYLRVIQLHVCIIYFFTGFDKAVGHYWWNGINMWRALMRTSLHHYDLSLLAKNPFILTISGITLVLLELSYCILIWQKQTRKMMLGFVILLHIAIALFMQLYFFSALMIIFNITAFGIKREKVNAT